MATRRRRRTDALGVCGECGESDHGLDSFRLRLAADAATFSRRWEAVCSAARAEWLEIHPQPPPAARLLTFQPRRLPPD